MSLRMLSFFSQAKRAVQRGATAVIFDVSENPDAIDQVWTREPSFIIASAGFFEKCWGWTSGHTGLRAHLHHDMQILTLANIVLWISYSFSGRQEAMNVLRMVERGEFWGLIFLLAFVRVQSPGLVLRFGERIEACFWPSSQEGFHCIVLCTEHSLWSVVLLSIHYFWDCKMAFQPCSNKFLQNLYLFFLVHSWCILG